MKYLPLTLRKNDVARFLPIVKSIVPAPIWFEAADRWKVAARSNILLTNYIGERHLHSLSLAALLKKYGVAGTMPSLNRTEFLPGMMLAQMIGNAWSRLSSTGRDRFRTTLRGALTSDAGIGPLYLELNVANELQQQGWTISFEDFDGRARFDLLASKDGVQVEVECKHIFPDIGHKVHKRDFIDLLNTMRPVLGASENRRGGLLIDILLPSRLEKSRECKQQITALVNAAINSGNQTSSAGPEISIHKFDPRLFPNFDPSTPTSANRFAQEIVKRHTGDTGGQSAIYATVHGGVTVVSCRSRQNNKVIDGVYRQLKEDAKKQFTGLKPALLFVRLAEMSQEQILSLQRSGPVKRSDAKGIEIISNMLVEKRPHIHSLIYLGREEVTPIPNGYSTSGYTYTFRNANHPQSSDKRLAFALDS